MIQARRQAQRTSQLGVNNVFNEILPADKLEPASREPATSVRDRATGLPGDGQ